VAGEVEEEDEEEEDVGGEDEDETDEKRGGDTAAGILAVTDWGGDGTGWSISATEPGWGKAGIEETVREGGSVSFLKKVNKLACFIRHHAT
jgi:hypothetical protein